MEEGQFHGKRHSHEIMN